MSNLSNEILNILLKNDIKPEDISLELFKIGQEINETLWETITISPTIFYKLKDTIFLNFEHLIYNDKITGRFNLKNYGTKFPAFLLATTNNYINKEYIESILNELDDIKKQWNSQIYAANLYSKQDFDWIIGDDNPSALIIYNKDNESPSKYGYYNNSSGKYGQIYSADGSILKKDNNVVLCAINKMDMYREYNLLTQTLESLYNTFRNAKKQDKGVFLDFNNYDYEH